MSWKVVVRTGPRVEAAPRRLAGRGARAARDRDARAANTERRGDVDVQFRRYAPAEQVAARAELRGRGPRVGFDVRGDGSVQGWTGRVRRRLVEPGDDETVYEALRRAVQSTSVEP